MKHTLQQVFRSGKFTIGFIILVALLLFVFIYPLFIKDAPLTIIGQGTFFPPGIYVSAYDSINAPTTYTLDLGNASDNRIDSKLDDQARQDIKDWLVADGIPADQIDTKNTKQLLDQWAKNYDPKKNVPGMTFAKTRYYQRLNTSLQGLLLPRVSSLPPPTRQQALWRRQALSNKLIT
jgi:peptide/nickel transport system permease protein